MTPIRYRLNIALILLALATTVAAAPAPAADSAPTTEPTPADTTSADSEDVWTPAADGLEHLVPALAARPYHLEPGVRPYLHRLSISPGLGFLGDERLFFLRAAFNPNEWLGYEAMLGHNPSGSVQGIVHRFSALVRRPLQGRFQPYLTTGYGMTIVLPGRSINADPVTKSSLSYGGGVEFYIRGDLALRAEMVGMTVIGRQQNRQGLVAYDYREETIALAFYRTLRP